MNLIEEARLNANENYGFTGNRKLPLSHRKCFSELHKLINKLEPFYNLAISTMENYCYLTVLRSLPKEMNDLIMKCNPDSIKEPKYPISDINEYGEWLAKGLIRRNNDYQLTFEYWLKNYKEFTPYNLSVT